MSSKLSRIAPAILVGVLNIIAPQVAYMALFAKIPYDERVRNFFNSPETSGIMDAHAQITIVFVTSIILIITSCIQLFRTENKTSKVFSAITIIIVCIMFIYIFLMGGAKHLPLEPYMRISEPGVTHFPPLNSWLTWLRIGLVMLGIILSLIELKESAKDVSDANS